MINALGCEISEHIIIHSCLYDYGGLGDEDRTELFEKLMKMPIDEVVKRGNIDGGKIFFKCPHCKKASLISKYGGNLIEESTTCPKCEQHITNEMIKENLETGIRGGGDALREHCTQS